MDDSFSRVNQMMDMLFEPLGDYAPRRRQLLVDYKDRSGMDFHQDLVTWHNRRATDEALVQSVREALAGKGHTLTALWEIIGGGRIKSLYMTPGYLEESLREFGLKAPKDLLEAMGAAGIHPVNWDELTREG